jgi:hypothetical protein
VFFGGVAFHQCRIPIEVMGVPLFEVGPSEVPGGPFQVSARFADAPGHPTLTIVNNGWQLDSGVWDAEVKGGRILVRGGVGSQSLVLRALPGKGVAVERLLMRFGRYAFRGDEETLRVVTRPDGVLPNAQDFTRCAVVNARVGMSFR